MLNGAKKQCEKRHLWSQTWPLCISTDENLSVMENFNLARTTRNNMRASKYILFYSYTLFNTCFFIFWWTVPFCECVRHKEGAYLQRVYVHGRRRRVFVSCAGRAGAAAGGSSHQSTDSCSEGKRSKAHKYQHHFHFFSPTSHSQASTEYRPFNGCLLIGQQMSCDPALLLHSKYFTSNDQY